MVILLLRLSWVEFVIRAVIAFTSSIGAQAAAQNPRIEVLRVS